MATLEMSSLDPVFYLHHTYIDHQFAYWQELQKLRGKPSIPDTPELYSTRLPLIPFKSMKGHKTSANNRGIDTADYKTSYCYDYDELMFDGMTPLEFLKNTTNTSNNTSFYIGVIFPKKSATGIHNLKLCGKASGEECVAVGSQATFGPMAFGHSGQIGKQVDSHSYYLVEHDVTEVVLRQGWQEERLTARLDSTLEGLVPEPFMIKRNRGQSSGGQIKKVRGYGDLLDKYTMVAPSEESEASRLGGLQLVGQIVGGLVLTTLIALMAICKFQYTRRGIA